MSTDLDMEIAALIFYILITLLIVLLAFVYFRGRNQVQQLITKHKLDESKLEQSHQTEVRLQEELTTLRLELHHINEDPLTHMLGWQLFTDRINQSLQESARFQLVMAILYIDINDFNVINSALGYEIGDAVLQEVSKRFRLCIRQIDSISRFSKDVFVVLLSRISKPETAAIVAQRILLSLEKPMEIEGHTLYVNARIGISVFPTDGQDTATLFRNAEHALQVAKSKGTQLYQFYQEKTHANSERELALSTGLKRESVPAEFEIRYQPIMNVNDNTIFCMQTLLLWRHPELGLISSQELFNYAEKQGKLNFIFEWLLKNACKQFLAWRDVGLHPILLGVSLSIRQLENSHFIYRISQTLQELNFNPEWLMLQIKESAMPISFEVIEKAFNMLKYLKVKLAIEDFGSHAISIRDLKNFAVDYLILDCSLISDIEKNERSKELIHAIEKMASSIGMELIVQDVQSQEQVTILKSLGCYLMQGKWIGEAVPENAGQ